MSFFYKKDDNESYKVVNSIVVRANSDESFTFRMNERAKIVGVCVVEGDNHAGMVLEVKKADGEDRMWNIIRQYILTYANFFPYERRYEICNEDKIRLQSVIDEEYMKGKPRRLIP